MLFNLNIVWPMLPVHGESFGVAKKRSRFGSLGRRSGRRGERGAAHVKLRLGGVSDRIGRRPVLLMGMFNSTFSVLVFGTATTYTQVRVYEGLHFQIPRLFGPITTTVTLSRYERLTLLLQSQCLVGRFLSGLLNGNAGVVKTYVGGNDE